MQAKYIFLLVLGSWLVSCALAQDKVSVIAVEMSRCPYCSLWKQNFQTSVMAKEGLPDIIDLNEWFIATKNGSDYTCLHGPEECVGNRILLCARNLTIKASPWGWWNLGVCMQTDYTNIPANAPACAQKVDLDWASINSCASSQVGADLFSNSVDVSRNTYHVTSTPTIFVNGKEYVGGPNNPLAVICNAYTGTKPAGCPK